MTYNRAGFVQNAVANSSSQCIQFAQPVAPFSYPSRHISSTFTLHPHYLISPWAPFCAVVFPSVNQYRHVNAPSAMPCHFQQNAYGVPPSGEVQHLQHNQPCSNLEQTPEGLNALADQCIKSSLSTTDAPLTQLRNALLLASEDEACVTKLTGVVVAQNLVICELKGNSTTCTAHGTRAEINQIQLLTKRVLK